MERGREWLEADLKLIQRAGGLEVIQGDLQYVARNLRLTGALIRVVDEMLAHGVGFLGSKLSPQLKWRSAAFEEGVGAPGLTFSPHPDAEHWFAKVYARDDYGEDDGVARSITVNHVFFDALGEAGVLQHVKQRLKPGSNGKVDLEDLPHVLAAVGLGRSFGHEAPCHYGVVDRMDAVLA